MSDSDSLVEIGVGAVLDADKLKIGNYVRMDGMVFVVTNTENGMVGLRPLTGLDLIRYHIKKKWGAVVFGIALLCVLFFLWLRSS